MTIFKSIILGLVQGVTEFLPVSSSGHLAILQKIFGLEEVPLLFDVVLHMATLLAVLLFFRKTILSLIGALIHIIYPEKTLSTDLLEYRENNRRYIVSVLLTTLVTGVIGLGTSKIISGKYSLIFVGIGMILTSGMLISSSIIEKRNEIRNMECILTAPIIPNEEKAPCWWQALLIGLFQGIGTLPGISRSGSTISGSLFCGVNRQMAGEYSFIASIPAILGAFLLELKDAKELLETVDKIPLIAGFIAAFVSGYVALYLLMKIIKKGRLEYFAFYLVPVSILTMIFLH